MHNGDKGTKRISYTQKKNAKIYELVLFFYELLHNMNKKEAPKRLFSFFLFLARIVL